MNKIWIVLLCLFAISPAFGDLPNYDHCNNAYDQCVGNCYAAEDPATERDCLWDCERAFEECWKSETNSWLIERPNDVSLFEAANKLLKKKEDR